MLAFCVFMLAGAYSLELFGQLPGAIVLGACVLAGLALLCRPASRSLGSFLSGFVIMSVAAGAQLDERLEVALQGQKLEISARVESFPERDGISARFVVRPLQRPDLPRRVRLTYFDPVILPDFGETWRFQVRLRRPRGLANPGGFDFAGWLFREQIGATGSVDETATNYRIHGAPPSVMQALRSGIVTRIERLLPADAATGVLLAISAGARHAISQSQWDLYARSGTSHLMAISGLHVGLAAASAGMLCWSLMVLAGTRGNVRDKSLIAALLVAVAYATLSGFAVPARRAILMTCVAGAAAIYRRRLRVATLLGVPCMAIFVTDPLAILAPGFKLSFAAVAIIMTTSCQYARARTFPRDSRLSRALSGVVRLSKLQLALLIGLSPLTILMFGRFSPGAPFVNMAVLPIFNLVTVPLTLLGVLLDGPLASLGDPLLRCAHSSVALTLDFIAALDQRFSLSQSTLQLPVPLILAALLPILYVLLPSGWPGRKVSLLAIFAVLNYRPSVTPFGCIDYRVFDVGQGLSVLLQTSTEDMLYDTGPAFRTGSSMAELVVIPYLQGYGITRLDRLIVSHPDSDHAGGAQAVLDALPVGKIQVGEPLPHINAEQIRCVAGVAWRVDGVSFSIRHPRIRAPWKRNNSSCVLEVTAGAHRLLLTGDIEAPVEKLLAHRGAILRSNVVIVPHHGSRTSSTAPLVQLTQPDIAIVATGFGNRWNFPKPQVVARWEAVGATVINTAASGSVTQRLCAGMAAGSVRLARPATRKYWHDYP